MNTPAPLITAYEATPERPNTLTPDPDEEDDVDDTGDDEGEGVYTI